MASRRQFTRFLGLSLLTGAGVMLQQGSASAAVATDLANANSGKLTIEAGAPGSHVEFLAKKYGADAPKNDGKHAEKYDDKKDSKDEDKGSKHEDKKHEDKKDPKTDVPPHEDVPPPKHETTPPPVKETPAPVVDKDECPTDVDERLVTHSWTINGVAGFKTLSGLQPGDTVQVDFEVAVGCEDQELSLAAYSAPSENFDPATADQQKLFDSETGKFDAGTHKLTVKIPDCYYQVDFVTGGVLEKLGPEGSKNFYGDRIIATDTGGAECVTPPVEITPPPAPPVEIASVVLDRPAEVAELAETGVETTELAMLGGYLLLMGIALESAARNRRRIPA